LEDDFSRLQSIETIEKLHPVWFEFDASPELQKRRRAKKSSC
jgi:hypothetical protein